jgi:hypothetical protein
MNIDDQLADWADDARRTTTPTRIPIEQFNGRSRGGRLIAVAATVVLVGGIAGAVAYTTGGDHPSRSRAAGSGGPSQSSEAPVSAIPPPAAGTRRVYFHGLSIDVPGKWATDATRCGAPIKDTVVDGDSGSDSCLILPLPKVSSATFTTWRQGGYHQPLTNPTQQSIKIDGRPATLTTGTLRGAHATVLVIPDLRAQVTVLTPSLTLGDQLVRTARVTDVDDNGCPARMSYVDLTSPPTSGPSDVMVNGAPTKVAVCRYLSTFLESGATLTDTQAGQLVTILNDLPPGLSAADTSTYSPSLCRTAESASQKYVEDIDDQDFSIRATYSESPPLVVYVRLGFCGALGASNGTRAGQRTDGLAQRLVQLGGSDVGWPGSVHPIN